MNGVNVFTMNLARGLMGTGTRATVLLTDPNRRETIPMARPGDLDFCELDIRPDDPMMPRWLRLRRFLEAQAPCIYIPNYDWHMSCVCPLLPSSIGVVGIVHADDPRHYEHLDRLGDTWNAVVAVSHAIGKTIRQTRPQFASRLHVIPIGVEIPAAKSKTATLGTHLRILYAGLLNRFQKRVFDVVDITRQLIECRTPIELTFAGGGDDEAQLRRTCRDLVEDGTVRFTGILDREQLSAEMTSHDVFILTSEFEGLPNALLEAMAHGLVPVVSAVESGISEVIVNGVNGLTAPIGDITGFTEHLTRLSNNPSMLENLSVQARATITDGPYGLRNMVTSYAAVFEETRRQIETGDVPRRGGGIRPPTDLGPLWRHRIPEPVRALWRRLKGSRRAADR